MKTKLSSLITRFKLLKKRWALALLLIVVLASSTIIVLNYYTIKILSTARAYVNGESQYSKGQKDASAHLINYILLETDNDYAAFEKAISIPTGDRIARVSLLSHNYNGAVKGFLMGNNNPKEVDDLIWLFNNFKSLTLFKSAIGLWTDADAKILDMRELGRISQQKINAGNISSVEKKSLILAISDISSQLTIKENAFSDTLGLLCRHVNTYVFIFDISIILVIVFSSLSYAAIMISKLDASQKKIMEQNNNLQVINTGLDKFVFNVTHDLRSPLTTLSSLLDLIEIEDDPDQIRLHTVVMRNSIEKQEQFISEMLSFIKSKQLGVVKQECSLATIIDNVITQNHFRSDGKPVNFYKEVELKTIESDALKLKVILNNLVSNSIKYCDPTKAEQWVRLKTYVFKTNAIIEVEDNGVGIRPKDQDRIFDKFYLSGKNQKSSGLGLYLVKDAVTQMNGNIEVKSELGVYTKFVISIPC